MSWVHTHEEHLESHNKSLTSESGAGEDFPFIVVPLIMFDEIAYDSKHISTLQQIKICNTRQGHKGAHQGIVAEGQELSCSGAQCVRAHHMGLMGCVQLNTVSQWIPKSSHYQVHGVKCIFTEHIHILLYI